MRLSIFASVTSAFLLASGVAAARPLLIDGSVSSNVCPGGGVRDGERACEYGGTQTFDYVELKNGAILYVKAFDGANLATSGNLVLKATGRDPSATFSIRVDRTSRIVAKGLGYSAIVCGDGAGPAAVPLAGGRGGCSVNDSGGGGGHIGAGGRGRRNDGTFEEACGRGLDPRGGACQAPIADCLNNDGLPSVAGASYAHSAYEPELGAAGGAQGCLDGFDAIGARGGNGGGRIALSAGDAARTGNIVIDGAIVADGHRGARRATTRRAAAPAGACCSYRTPCSSGRMHVSPPAVGRAATPRRSACRATRTATASPDRSARP